MMFAPDTVLLWGKRPIMTLKISGKETACYE